MFGSLFLVTSMNCFQVVWSFLAPLAITIVAIILICPTTAKWCVNQTVPAFELFLTEYLDKCQAFLSRIHA